MMAHGSSSSVVICSRCFGPLLGSYCTRSCCNAAKGTAMHYYAYEFAHSVLSPMRFGVSGLRSMLDWPFNPMANTPYGRHLAAACELFENVTRRYGKPEFGLKTTRIGGVEVGVREQVIASTPFGRLLHFKRDETGLTGKRYDPKVLIVAPMSGHYATLLRGTVKAMLPDHETYITDWHDA